MWWNLAFVMFQVASSLLKSRFHCVLIVRECFPWGKIFLFIGDRFQYFWNICAQQAQPSNPFLYTWINLNKNKKESEKCCAKTRKELYTQSQILEKIGDKGWRTNWLTTWVQDPRLWFEIYSRLPLRLLFILIFANDMRNLAKMKARKKDEKATPSSLHIIFGIVLHLHCTSIFSQFYLSKKKILNFNCATT